MTRPYAITFNTEAGLTKQSFKDECNINKIMDKFQKTGVISHYANHGPQYMEIAPGDFLDAQLVIAKAQTMFEELPSQVRKRFDNSPEQFLEFVQNPNNQEEAYKLGLASEPPVKPSEQDKPPKKHASASSEPAQGSKPKDD